jgi:hypothetical protein
MRNDEDDLKSEDIERRREVRGIVPGLVIRLTRPRQVEFAAVEASRRGFFVDAADPEEFHLADVHDAEIEKDSRLVRCRLEVIRKEIEPRRGVALRISFIDPPNEEALKQLLGFAR